MAQSAGRFCAGNPETVPVVIADSQDAKPGGKPKKIDSLDGIDAQPLESQYVPKTGPKLDASQSVGSLGTSKPDVAKTTPSEPMASPSFDTTLGTQPRPPQGDRGEAKTPQEQVTVPAPTPGDDSDENLESVSVAARKSPQPAVGKRDPNYWKSLSWFLLLFCCDVYTWLCTCMIIL